MSANRIFMKFVSTLVCITIMTACTSKETPIPPTNTPEPIKTLDGTWTSTITKEDILRVDPNFLQEYLCDNAGTMVWKFNDDGTWSMDQTVLADCPPAAVTHVEDKWSIDGNKLTLAPGTPDQELYEFSIANDQLTLKVISSNCPTCIVINTANPWTRVK